MSDNHINLEDLHVYRLSLELSKKAWKIYEKFSWQDRKIIGDQFITAIDSVGANIAEGYGRYHYLDRIKFYYNSRGSLLESKHWVQLLIERNKIENNLSQEIMNEIYNLHKCLNSFINSCYPKK